MKRKVVRLLMPFLKDNGFQQVLGVFARRKGEMVTMIGIDAAGLVYCTVAVMPLYMPADVRNYCYGNRVGSPLKRDATAQMLCNWAEELRVELESETFPFLDRISTPALLLDALRRENSAIGRRFFCPPIQLTRLRLYTQLYQMERHGLEEAIVAAKSELLLCKGYSPQVIERYHLELEWFAAMVKQSDSDIAQAFEAIMEETRRNCFPGIE